MKNQLVTFFGMIVLLFATTASPAMAGIIFDNTGFSSSGVQLVQPENGVGNGSYAQAFSTTSASTITEIELRMSNLSGSTFSIDIFSSIGSVPFALVASVLSGSGNFVSPKIIPLNISLSQNTDYYVVATVTSGSLSWSYTGATTGLNAFNNGNGWTSTTDQPLQMKVTAVPEPAPAALLGIALLAGGIVALRQKRSGSIA